ncbi:MAG: TolB family protein [Candidatus Kapaibacterium sp.]
MLNYFKIFIVIILLGFLAVSCKENGNEPQSEKSYILYNSFSTEIKGMDGVKINQLSIDGNKSSITESSPAGVMLCGRIRSGNMLTASWVEPGNFEIELKQALDGMGLGSKVIDKPNAVLAPDGFRMFYVTIEDDAPRDLAMYNFDTAEEAILAEGVTNETIDISPDGEWLAFIKYEEENERSYLYKCRTDGSELTKLNNDSLRKKPGYQTIIDWTHDGANVLVMDYHIGPGLVSADASYDTQYFNENCDWIAASPTEDKFVYVSLNNILIKYGFDGTSTNIANAQSDSIAYWAPTWSHSGRGLAIWKINRQAYTIELVTYDLNSSEIMEHPETRKTFDPEDMEEIFISAYNTSVNWVK